MKLLTTLLLLGLLLCNELVLSQCTTATKPVVTSSIDTSGFCFFNNLKIYVQSGTLNSDTAWYWYTASCGGSLVGIGDTIYPVVPAKRQTFYVRGGGPCSHSSPCTSIEVYGDTTPPQPLVNPLPPLKAQCYIEATTLSTRPYAYEECTNSNFPANLVAGSCCIYTQGRDTVTWSFADPVYNVTLQEQIFIVDDTIAPVPGIAVLPVINAQCDTTVSVYPTGIDNCAASVPLPGPGPITATTLSSLTFVNQGLDSISWIYDDSRGNVFTQKQYVNVEDTTAPGIICPSDTVITIPTSQTTAVVNYIDAIGVDNCGGVVNHFYVLNGATTGTFIGKPSGQVFNLDTTVVNYILQDSHGNSSTCSTKVIIEYPNNCTVATKPSLSYTVDTGLACAYTNLKVFITNGMLNTHLNWRWYTDSCGGKLIGVGDTIYPTVPLDSMRYYVRGEGGCTKIAPCAEILVIGRDTVPPVPVINPLPNLKGDCYAGIFSLSQVPLALDNCIGMIQGIPIGNTQKFNQGTDTIYWKFRDFSNNEFTQMQVIHVEDSILPVPDLNVLPIIKSQCDTTVNHFPTSIDNCTGSSTPLPGPGVLKAITSSNLYFSQQGIDSIHWVYDDLHGNKVIQIQYVEIKDTIEPRMICPQNTTVYIPKTQNAAVISGIGALALDNCSSKIDFSYRRSGSISDTAVGSPSGLVYNLGKTKIEYFAKDEAGNVASCSTSITVTNLSTGIVSRTSQLVRIYPQPNQGRFTLFIGEYEGTQIQLRVMNSSGMKLQELQFKNQRENGIDLSALPAGRYLLEIIIADKAKLIEQLIIE